MKEIGATLDLSESRVSQMHSSILARLKAQIASLGQQRRQLIGGESSRLHGNRPLIAIGHHANPRLALTFDDSRKWVAYGINHLDLLDRPEVYAQIKQWLAASG